MKPRVFFWSFLIYLVVFSCSKDDGQLPPKASLKSPDFTLLAQDFDNLYQYSHNGATKEGSTVNLTEESGLGTQFLTLRQVNNLLTFYRFSSGSFTAIQRNVATGQNKLFENFYAISTEQSVIWGTNSESKFFMGYYSPRGSTNLGIRIIDPSTDENVDLSLDFNVKNVYQPLYFNKRLLIPYLDGRSDYKIAVLNTVTNTVIKTLDFGDAIPSILIDDLGDVGVITGSNGNQYGYTTYDFGTFEIKTTENFSVNRFFSPGPLEADVIDGTLYYLNFYAQPSLVEFGPAVYDFKKSENNIIDMISIVQQVQNEMQTTINLSAFGYVENAEVFIVGYATQDTAGLEGGVLLISTEGELLSNIILPFAPTYIVQ